MDRYEEMPNPATITRWAEIISYNIFRMDGLTFCIPETDIPARIMNWDKNQMENFNE